MRYDESGIPIQVPQAPRNDSDDENEPGSGGNRGTGGGKDPSNPRDHDGKPEGGAPTDGDESQTSGGDGGVLGKAAGAMDTCGPVERSDLKRRNDGNTT
ncbi:hypothetical protein K440DRAFT_240572 [Wilcoxina mikolae CBS 423.85]|nr:hypothetical protein K440DRAFT_240572 [Wilcoxina mikolae CBS 423.85]